MKPVWDKPNPVKNSEKLSPEQKARAKARARAAGRPYPNMVDNIWAARNEQMTNPYTDLLDEAKATPCGRCGTTHVPPSKGGTCPALKEEQVDEISKDLANRYMWAAKSDRAGTDEKMHKAVEKNSKDFSSRRSKNIGKLLDQSSKRTTGILRALNRLQKEAVDPKEHDRNVEMYGKRAATLLKHHRDTYEKSQQQKKAGDTETAAKTQATASRAHKLFLKARDKFQQHPDNREAHIRRMMSGASDYYKSKKPGEYTGDSFDPTLTNSNPYIGEEAINELSKDKLNKYIQRATGEHGHYNMARRNTTGDVQKEFARKETKRQTGISKAFDKLDAKKGVVEATSAAIRMQRALEKIKADRERRERLAAPYVQSVFKKKEDDKRQKPIGEQNINEFLPVVMAALGRGGAGAAARVVGSVVGSTAAAAGSIAGGIAQGVGSAVGGVAKGVGSAVGGIVQGVDNATGGEEAKKKKTTTSNTDYVKEALVDTARQEREARKQKNQARNAREAASNPVSFQSYIKPKGNTNEETN